MNKEHLGSTDKQRGQSCQDPDAETVGQNGDEDCAFQAKSGCHGRRMNGNGQTRKTSPGAMISLKQPCWSWCHP